MRRNIRKIYTAQKENKAKRKKIEEKWSNLISEEEKSFYKLSHFSALENAVDKIIMGKSIDEVNQCIIEVEYLYRKSMNHNDALTQIGIPSILVLISGAYMLYILVYQTPLNLKYSIKSTKDGLELIIPNGSFVFPFFLLLVFISLIIISILKMTKNLEKNKKNTYYYKNLMEILTKKRDTKSYILKYNSKIVWSTIMILGVIKKTLKRR